jgi:hypothetical protein
VRAEVNEHVGLVLLWCPLTRSKHSRLA